MQAGATKVANDKKCSFFAILQKKSCISAHRGVYSARTQCDNHARLAELVDALD